MKKNLILLVFFTLITFLSEARSDTVSFAGYTWEVKDYCSTQVGPGPNYFCPENVSVDGNGYLHLEISYNQTLQDYTCASIKTPVQGCGTFVFDVEGGFPDNDENAVLGLFTYSDDSEENYHEIDVEMARFGDSDGENLGYTTWDGGYSTSDDYFVDLSEDSTHEISWQPDIIRFNSYSGSTMLTNGGYRYGIYSCDTDANIQAHINFWMFQGNTPISEHEIVLTDFSYYPYNSVLQPTSLSVSDVNDAAYLTWSNASIGDVFVQIDRNLNDAGFTSLDTETSTDYTDNSLDYGDCAIYRVKTCHESTCSIVSDTDGVCIDEEDTEGGELDVSISGWLTGGCSSGYVDGNIDNYDSSGDPRHVRTWVWVDNDVVYNQGADLSPDQDGDFHATCLWLSNPGSNKKFYVTLHEADNDQYGTDIHVSSTYIPLNQWDGYFDEDVLVFGPFPTN